MNDKELDEYRGLYESSNILPAFEGAATDYKKDLRNLVAGEADSLAARELKLLQARSAHALRNNGYAQTAFKRWITNANYIRVLWKDKKGKRHDLMQDLYDEFCENPSYDNFGDIRVFQGVSNASIFTFGNSYIRNLIVRKGNKNRIPLKLQLIPAMLHNVEHSSYIGNPQTNKTIRYGITFENSIPSEYHFRKSIIERQNDANAVSNIVVPANEIIHTFVRKEPGQWLGIPELSPVLMNLYSLSDLLEATVEKQKAAQAIAILIEQTNHAISQVPVGVPTMAKDENGNDKIYFKAKGGNVQYLNKGESAKMFQGADIGNNFGTLVDIELRQITACLDVMYHEVTGNTENLNYSSLIGLSIIARNRIEYLHNTLFIPLREKPITDYFKELASLYYPKVKNAIPHFQLPHWRHIDDLKDAQSDVLELQNGLDLYTNKLAERGISVDDLIEDRKTLETLAEYGITFQSEASMMAQANNIKPNDNTSGI